MLPLRYHSCELRVECILVDVAVEVQHPQGGHRFLRIIIACGGIGARLGGVGVRHGVRVCAGLLQYVRYSPSLCIHCTLLLLKLQCSSDELAGIRLPYQRISHRIAYVLIGIQDADRGWSMGPAVAFVRHPCA